MVYTHIQNKKLLEKVPDTEDHMYTDKYYSSIILAEELLQMKCHFSGTIKINRKGIPIEIRKLKFLTKRTFA